MNRETKILLGIGGATLGAVGLAFGARAAQKRGMLPALPGLSFHATPSLAGPRALFKAGVRMFDTVLDAFLSFTGKWEGNSQPFMYQDIKGLLTTNMGILLDTVPHSPTPTAFANALPWKHADGTPASLADVANEWSRISARTDLQRFGGGAYGKIATLHLDPADVQAIVQGKLANNTKILLSNYPSFQSWPLDAQAALHSMAWAMGPAFRYPKFKAAVNQSPPDFVTAAKESYIPDAANPGLKPRNAANALMFQNAAAVLAQGLDKNKVYWPSAVT